MKEPNLQERSPYHFEGYLREEALTKEDMVLYDVNKPDADTSAKSVDVASTSGRIPKKKNASTPL